MLLRCDAVLFLICDFATGIDCNAQISICKFEILSTVTDARIFKMQAKEEKSQQGFDLGISEHLLSVEDVCQKFETDVQQGLPETLVEVNRKKYGANHLSPPIPRSRFYRLLKHVLQGVSSLMVSGAIVCLMGFVADLIGNVDSKIDMENLFLGIALVLFITITGTFSYIRERVTTNVLKRSLSLVPRKTLVVRNGNRVCIDVREIVVGDLVELKYGDQVPADIRVIESVGFKVDTAPLTGLSEPKIIKAEYTHINPLITQNMLYSSTYGVEGFSRGIVIRVGDNTVLGRITGITSQLKEKQTPLSKDVTKLILTFTSFGFLIAIICWVAAMRLDYSWSNTTVFFVGVCVATVPESLLAAIRVCHYVAAKRLIKQGCIAKRFDAIENLGSTTVLCIDKTGTLTENKLAVCSIWAGASLVVVDDKIQEPADARAFWSKLRGLLACITLTCKASVQVLDGGTFDVKDGEPADVALLKFALSADDLSMKLKMESTKIHEAPYNYRNFYQLSVYLEKGSSSKCRVVVRGAPERIIRLCKTIVVEGKEVPLTDEARNSVESELHSMAKKQERVFGFCDKVIPYSKDMIFNEHNKNSLIGEYRYLGLVSMSDPPRTTAKKLIASLRSASIKIVMLTGDHPETAMAIAQAVGIISTENDIISNTGRDAKSRIFTDSDMKDLIQARKLGEIIKEVDELVFARLSPEQKAIIVEAFQRQGQLVTMVGDGINDCAAMRAADTSISLGPASSEAAKEVCDIVIIENDLTTIVNGIEQGRLVFENMKKCFAFTISSNIPEILPFLLFLFLEIPLPINPISIILLSIGVDMLPAIALAYEPAEWDLMKNPIQESLKQHKLFSGRLMERAYARIGIAEFAAGMFAYAFVMSENGFHVGDLFFISRRWYSNRVISDAHGQEWTHDQRQHLEDIAQTVYFYAVALVQFAHLIGCKTRRQSIFSHGIRNWRLIVALVIPLALTTVIVKTQVMHIIETSRTESIPLSLLLPALPFAGFIFIYDEFRRLLIRRFKGRWLGERLDF